MQESPELRRVVEGYYAAAMEGNRDWVADTLSDSDAALAIGTDPAEWWEGGSTIRRMWAAQLEAGLGGAKLEPTRLRAYEEGDVGWATDQPRMVLPNGNRVSVRISAVFPAISPTMGFSCASAIESVMSALGYLLDVEAVLR